VATVRLRPLDGILGWRYAPVFVQSCRNSVTRSVQEQARTRTQHNTTCYIHSLVPKSAILLCNRISQGSVATCLKRCGIFKHEFVANLLPSLLVKTF